MGYIGCKLRSFPFLFFFWLFFQMEIGQYTRLINVQFVVGLFSLHGMFMLLIILVDRRKKGVGGIPFLMKLGSLALFSSGQKITV